MMFCQTQIDITDATQVGSARREASRLGSEAGLNDSDNGKAAIIASELATNLSRYAQGGEILLRSFAIAETAGIEMISIDRGPGMNVGRCLEDGYSTGGSAGTGLGAVRRMASEFDIFSTSPGGTVVIARVHNATASRGANAGFQWGVINRPAKHETVSGDTWRIAKRAGEISLMVADGLGHGPLASESAEAAATAFERDGFGSPTELLVSADRMMRGTRGAAVALANWNVTSGKLTYAGVGNIAGSLRSRDSLKGRGLMSHNGTVGVEMRKVQSFDYECLPGSLLIMHSDGLMSRWSLDPYPGLIDRHPATVASVLYRDFCRGRDDITVCAVRCSAAMAA